MKNNVPQVLVSHAGKQYVHQLCFALQRDGYLKKFITSFWYKPDVMLFRCLSLLPVSLFSKIEKGAKKRYFKPLHQESISTFPLPELIRQTANAIFKLKSEKWVFYIERMHDWYVAEAVRKMDADIVIGYEKSSLKTFFTAKKLNKITVLDLAQVHFTHIENLRNQYKDFEKLRVSDALLGEINKIKRQEYLYADYIFVLSTYAKQTLIRANIPENIIYTLNLGFDPKNFTLKTEYNLHKKFEILFVGTITNRKGVHLLLEAFRQLNLENAHLKIVGPMDDGGHILEKYEGLFTYIPFLHHEELVKYYQNAHVFVFPSYLDSWAMTVVEAMACGTPVIVSENTGSKDAVNKGGGFVIPVDDIEALKEKIAFFYYNRDQIKELGLQAHQIAQQYTWGNYYAQVKNAIEAIWQQEHAKDKVLKV